MGCPLRSPPKVLLDDSSIHGGPHEDLPHVSARLDARSAFFAQTVGTTYSASPRALCQPAAPFEDSSGSGLALLALMLTIASSF